jgi:hypothetical protein
MAKVPLSNVTVVLQRYPGTAGPDAERAIADVPYKLIVGGKEKAKGKSGADGTIVLFFIGSEAILEVFDTPYSLKHFGAIEALTTLRGEQRRLQMLGYELGHVDGTMGGKTGNALLNFQADNAPLDTDGKLSAAVQNQLKGQFGE